MVALVVEAVNEQGDEGAAVRLGRALKKARESAGVSGPELARRLNAAGVSDAIEASHIYRWEAGGRPLNLGLIEAAEQLMGLDAGTVLRLAGYVDDGGLINVATLPGWANKAVRAILRDLSIEGDGTNRPDSAPQLEK